MVDRKQIGNIGENIAVSYMQKSGYEIIERNFSGRLGEIDVIAKEGRYLCFVEVKARCDIRHGYPREAVTVQKQNKIKHMAMLYISKHKLYDVSVRFDVVEIMLNEDMTMKDIVILKNAFE